MYLVSKLSQYHSVRKSEAFVPTNGTFCYIVCMVEKFFTDLVVNINLSKIVSYQAEGLTAIEVWMLTCILFVFGKIIYNYLFIYLNGYEGKCTTKKQFLIDVFQMAEITAE